MAKDTIMGTKTYNGKDTALSVSMREACACKRDVPRVSEFAFGRLGVTAAHASLLAQLGGGVLIGAGGMWAF